MNGPVPVSDYVEHFDPELPHHRAWLQAVLEQLVALDPAALEEGGALRRLWIQHQKEKIQAMFHLTDRMAMIVKLRFRYFAMLTPAGTRIL